MGRGQGRSHTRAHTTCNQHQNTHTFNAHQNGKRTLENTASGGGATPAAGFRIGINWNGWNSHRNGNRTIRSRYGCTHLRRRCWRSRSPTSSRPRPRGRCSSRSMAPGAADGSAAGWRVAGGRGAAEGGCQGGEGQAQRSWAAGSVPTNGATNDRRHPMPPPPT